jgi:hypothetical protein
MGAETIFNILLNFTATFFNSFSEERVKIQIILSFFIRLKSLEC